MCKKEQTKRKKTRQNQRMKRPKERFNDGNEGREKTLALMEGLIDPDGTNGGLADGQ